MSGARLLVNEVFETFQGEASFTGTPAVFLRLQGCDVGCPWCDTKHTWGRDPGDLIPAGAMVAKDRDAPSHASMSVGEIVDMIAGRFTARHVVITGGEPCASDIFSLTAALIRCGWSVQVETSGTEPVRVAAGTWVTVSPKIGMPGRRDVLAEAMERADEIKFPVGKMADIAKLDALLERCPAPSLVWLQPLSQSQKATDLCMEVARDRGWRVSLQVHKYLGVR